MGQGGTGERPLRRSYDVVIVGGAMIGSSIAWFLTDNPDFDGTVLVVERDPQYQFASTSHTNSCIRQQFSTELNIRISQFGIEFVKNFRVFMGNDPRVPNVALHSHGYMYLAGTEQFAQSLRANQRLQSACGAGTRHLLPDQIARDYPFYNLDGIIAANHNPVDEGYFEGSTLFDWWKRLARERGVEFLAGEVVGMTRDDSGSRVTGVTLGSGETVACGCVVNASGPRAALTARMAGIDIPVEPRKRYTFIFDAARPIEQAMPLTIDPSGVHVRRDGAYYMCGCPPDNDGPVDVADFAQDFSIWEAKVWPAIAHRIPQFDALKLVNSWVGHYAYNTLDQNAIVGPHCRVGNFLFANGFSGHGLQQSPAVGRGIAELIAYGEYRTLDLGQLGFDRIERNQPLVEKAVI